MESTDSDGLARDNASVAIDRIEGGSLARADRELRGIAPMTALIGAVVVVLFGLLLGWYLFHARGTPGKTPAATAGTAASVPQREAITQDQVRQALLGSGAAGSPGSTASGANGVGPGIGPDGQQLPVGMTATPGAPGTATTQAGPNAQHPVDPRVALDLASRRSPIMGFSGSMSALGQSERAPEAPAGAGNPGLTQVSLPQREGGDGTTTQPPVGPTAGAGQDGLSSQLGHHVIETARAMVVPDRSFLLSAGTLVPCTLQTAINSTQAGYVSCVIGSDVYSEDGRVVLLDKGTKVLGQYSGGIAQGQARLFVLWTRALTPRGVAIDLGSPAADDLGRAGMSGGVDTMFWQRFGGALMLSVLEDLGNIASSHFANAGTQTTQVPADTAGVALQSSINIRPVLKKNQGDQVAIFVAKDFDFTGVYNVRVRR
jgi:type IV secretion system protein VirB10